MQSGTSCFNKTIFKKNITHFWPIWGIYLVFLLYALPLTLLLSTENPGTGAKAAKQIAEDNLARYTTCLGGALTPMFVFVAATVCAMTVFFYLYQNRSANMIHALPVSRKELYVTNVVSGFLFLIVPQILTFVITAFVCFARDISRLEYAVLAVDDHGNEPVCLCGSHRDRNVDRTAFSSSGLLCHSQLFICRDPVYLSDITDRNGLRNGSPFPIQQREISLSAVLFRNECVYSYGFR